MDTETKKKKVYKESELAAAGIKKVVRNDEYATLLLPLARDERTRLGQDLETNGLLQPILIDEAGNLLDGHHRHALCEEHQVERRYRVMWDLTVEEKKELVYSRNLDRRQISPDQMKEIYAKRRENLERLRVANPAKYTNFYVASKLGLTEGAIRKMHNRTCPNRKLDGRVKIPRSLHAEIKQRTDAGEAIEQIAAEFGVAKSTISKVVKKQAEREAVVACALGADPNPQVDFRQGDFTDVLADLAPGSIDAIITDPPYERKGLDLWSSVAEFAAEKLRPNGMFVAYTGVAYLPEVLDALRKHLDFYWLGTVRLMGETGIAPAGRSVRQRHRPFIVCRRKGAPKWDHDAFPDLIEGSKAEKDLHPWQQSLGEFETLVNLFTEPGQVVVDPFACTGTTLVAAHRLGRVAIGAEKDPEAHAIGVGRVGRDTAECEEEAVITPPEAIRGNEPAGPIGVSPLEA